MNVGKFIFGASLIILFASFLYSFQYSRIRSGAPLDIKPTPGFPEEVKDKGMPPAKYLNRNPDKVLTEEQMGTFSKWAKEESDKLRDESKNKT